MPSSLKFRNKIDPALRTQSDKVACAHCMQKVIEKQKNLTIIIEGTVNILLIKAGKAVGVKVNSRKIIHHSLVINHWYLFRNANRIV